MATKLFLKDAVADTHLGTDNLNLLSSAVGWVSKALSTTQGSSVIASDAVATVTGPTTGITITKTSAVEWISPPISADVTISGTITCNIWGAESSMSANVAINARIFVIRANATATRNANTLDTIATTAFTTELALTTRAVNNFTVTPTSTAVNRGDRIRVILYGDDSAAATMATGFTFNVSWDGGAAADGDTYVSFTENFSFESAPAGSQLFLTNTQSGLTAAPALISSFTGADENPLSEGGNWANVNTSSNPLKRLSNAATASVNAAQNNSYWTPANFGPDLEAYVSLGAIAATSQGICVRVQGEGGAGTWDGYRVVVSTGAASIQRIDNAAATGISPSMSASWASGDKLGVRCSGSTIQCWRQASGSSDWNLEGSVVDATYASAGKIGLHATATTQALDDFYAATDSNLFTQKAWTSRGAGVVSYRSDTDAGWTAPLYTTDWYTPELEAFTLTGMAQANIRALESNASANASLRCEIARVDSDGTNPTIWASWCCAPTGTDNGELTTSEVARTINVSGDDLAFTDGQRLRIRLYNEDISSAAMANAFNVQRFFNGTSAAASGDSYVTLAQSVSEYSSTPATSYMLPNRNIAVIRR